MKRTARLLICSVLLAGITILTSCWRETPGVASDEPTSEHSSKVVSVITGERPHCESGIFTYTEKIIQLTGTQTTGCQHGRVGYVDVRNQYARDVSGDCDLCGFHQEDVREELWWGDMRCEEISDDYGLSN